MSITISFSTTSNLQDWAFDAVIHAERAIEDLSSIQKNLDTSRAIFTKSASSQGLKCEIIPIEAYKTHNTWQVYFKNSLGVSTLVAVITETGIAKQNIPLLCPMCGKPSMDESNPGTNAHNVVSASIWREVLDEVFTLAFRAYLVAPTPQKTIDGTNDLLDSLKKVASGTGRSSTIGAATQGDRRTCKACEQIHGSLSLLQRDNAMRSLVSEPLIPYYEKNSKGKKELIGALHIIPKPLALGLEFGGTEGGGVFSRDILEEITRQRIEDVIRGIANEIYSQKYRPANSHGALKEGYECMTIFNDTTKYYAFLDLIRDKAFKKSGSRPTDAGQESNFLQKIQTKEYISYAK
ncbi:MULTISPECIES: hypothetical protein [unclassified Pseudomonas]|uniref:hypothetical protein n=1 Tax=unclassified Pseudomonas TaxID=196821 RepID=UPI00201058A6|nr:MULTISPECIES: hypothetical protein [unclassified Pseudomonas]